jgi:ubiquinone/menaquinone biosynthesis C-methylase UbiE/uncharacterized protein YbaR (Trm112 family)
VTDLRDLLACPACGGELAFSERDHGEWLGCTRCTRSFPVIAGIPRFVSSEAYTASFGFQWNRFRRTQLDSANGTSISRDRFLAQSGWTPEMLRGARVLDGGAGSGRFAEVALSLGAEVVALDYSTAIEALAGNFPAGARLTLVQGDLLALPFKAASFDVVYSFGVLQHTADARAALAQLARVLKPGGRLAVDIYSGGLSYWTHPRFWLRPLTRRIPAPTLFRLVERYVPWLLPLSRGCARVPLVGRALRRMVPVANYEGRLPLTERQLYEWAVLDTFDWLSPRFDRPQTPETLRSWLGEAGLADVEIVQPVMLTGRGRRP